MDLHMNPSTNLPFLEHLTRSQNTGVAEGDPFWLGQLTHFRSPTPVMLFWPMAGQGSQKAQELRKHEENVQLL